VINLPERLGQLVLMLSSDQEDEQGAAIARTLESHGLSWHVLKDAIVSGFAEAEKLHSARGSWRAAVEAAIKDPNLYRLLEINRGFLRAVSEYLASRDLSPKQLSWLLSIRSQLEIMRAAKSMTCDRPRSTARRHVRAGSGEFNGNMELS
jgi:hypothetical protein